MIKIKRIFCSNVRLKRFRHFVIGDERWPRVVLCEMLDEITSPIRQAASLFDRAVMWSDETSLLDDHPSRLDVSYPYLKSSFTMQRLLHAKM